MNRRVGLTVGLVALALGGLAAPAQAVTAKFAYFTATLSGTQSQSSSVPGDPAAGCPPVQATERLSFQSRAPFRLEITYLGSEMVVGSTGQARLTARGAVTRTKTAAGCDAGDDPDKPLDCGTRPFSRWQLYFQAVGRGLNLMQAATERADLFANCTPIGPTSYPSILSPEDRAVVARVSRRAVLDKHRKTITARAHAIETVGRDGGGSSRTTLTYTLKLRRRSR